VIRKEEESSATDSLSEDVTDVTEVRKKEEGRRKMQFYC
jgi:ribosomal protein S5